MSILNMLAEVYNSSVMSVLVKAPWAKDSREAIGVICWTNLLTVPADKYGYSGNIGGSFLQMGSE